MASIGKEIERDRRCPDAAAERRPQLPQPWRLCDRERRPAATRRDDIVADYLLINTAGDAEARIAAGMATMMAIAGARDEAAMRVLMGVEAAYIETLFATLTARHGSPEDYLVEVLGVDRALRDRLCDALVEG